MTEVRKRPSSALVFGGEREASRPIRAARHRELRSADQDKLGLLIREHYLRQFDQGKTVEDNWERITQ